MPLLLVSIKNQQIKIISRNLNYFVGTNYKMSNQSRTIEAIGNLIIRSEKSNVIIHKLAPATQPDQPYIKSQVDGLVATERTARDGAVSLEASNRASADVVELNARTQADALEKTQREGADALEKLQREGADTTEQQARTQADTTERSARIEADAAEQQARLEAISEERASRVQAIEDEQFAREFSITNLRDSFTATGDLLKDRVSTLESSVDTKIRRVALIPSNLALGENTLTISQLELKNSTAHVLLKCLVRKGNNSNAYSADFLVESDDDGILSLIGESTNISKLHEDNETYDFDVAINGMVIQAKIYTPIAGGSAMVVANVEVLTVAPTSSVAAGTGGALLELKTDFNRVYLEGGVKKLKASFQDVGLLASYLDKQVEVSGLVASPVNVTLSSVSGTTAYFVGSELATVPNAFYSSDCTYKVIGVVNASYQYINSTASVNSPTFVKHMKQASTGLEFTVYIDETVEDSYKLQKVIVHSFGTIPVTALPSGTYNMLFRGIQVDAMFAGTNGVTFRLPDELVASGPSIEIHASYDGTINVGNSNGDNTYVKLFFPTMIRYEGLIAHL